MRLSKIIACALIPLSTTISQAFAEDPTKSIAKGNIFLTGNFPLSMKEQLDSGCNELISLAEDEAQGPFFIVVSELDNGWSHRPVLTKKCIQKLGEGVCNSIKKELFIPFERVTSSYGESIRHIFVIENQTLGCAHINEINITDGWGTNIQDVSGCFPNTNTKPTSDIALQCQ